jgi:hypothetical protein
MKILVVFSVPPGKSNLINLQILITNSPAQRLLYKIHNQLHVLDTSNHLQADYIKLHLVVIILWPQKEM